MMAAHSPELTTSFLLSLGCAFEGTSLSFLIQQVLMLLFSVFLLKIVYEMNIPKFANVYRFIIPLSKMSRSQMLQRQNFGGFER